MSGISENFDDCEWLPGCDARLCDILTPTTYRGHSKQTDAAHFRTPKEPEFHFRRFFLQRNCGRLLVAFVKSLRNRAPLGNTITTVNK
jgi:hypothetical protein